MNEFIEESTKKNFKSIENCLYYVIDTKTLLETILNNKDILKNCYASNLKENKKLNIFNFQTLKKEDDIETICETIKSLIDYQKEKKCIFLDFNIDFWQFCLEQYKNINDVEDIDKLNRLRDCLKDYQLSVKSEKDLKKIIDYYTKDDYGTTIHKGILNLIKSKDIKDLDLLNLVFEKDPYYKEKKKEKNLDILNNINFKNIENEEFFTKFKELHLDEVFEDKIDDFFKLIFKLVDQFSDFNLLFKLLDIKVMKPKNLEKYFKYLKDKFTEVTINIDENNENEYNKTKNLLYLFLEIIIKSKKPEEFLMTKFEKKLDEKVYFELYIKILETVFEDKKKDLIKYIFQKMKKNINIKYTLMFAREINNEKLKKQYFDELKELKELFFFKYEDFFSEKNHKGIELFIALTEKDCMYKNCDFYNENMKAINQLKDKFNELTIKKPQVEELFKKLNEETILERLKLICENQNEMYNKIKSKLKEVKKEIDYLENMKNLLSIYHKKEIEKNKDLTEIIKSLNEEELNKIDEKMKKINEIKEKYKDLIELIKKVKDSKFFSIIYKITQEKEEKDKKCFKESIEILKNQKNIIKDPEEVDNIYFEPFFSTLKNNEIKDEIKRLCNFYEDSIDNDLLEDKFLVLINKEKYCKVIESILFFLDKIEANKTKFSEELNNFIDDVKKKKGKYEIIKKYLTSFNKEGIFDYLDENSNKYLEFFKHLENKELAIAFLKKKI